MFKLVYILAIIIAFFFPWTALIIVVFSVLYLIYTYSSSIKHSMQALSYYKRAIVAHFEEKIGDGEYHYSYISKNSVYFLSPSSSKLFSSVLKNISGVLVLFIVNYFFRYNENSWLYIVVSLIFMVISFNLSLKFTAPIVAYKMRETKSFTKKERMGLEEYPEFFYHGAWQRIKNE